MFNGVGTIVEWDRKKQKNAPKLISKAAVPARRHAKQGKEHKVCHRRRHPDPERPPAMDSEYECSSQKGVGHPHQSAQRGGRVPTRVERVLVQTRSCKSNAGKRYN